MEYNQTFTQTCNQCGENLRPLFFTLFCPACENKSSGMLAGDNVGYIVWRGNPPGSCKYVFRTLDDGIKWRDAVLMGQFPMRAVRNSGSVFRWKQITVKHMDIWFADRTYEIFPTKDSAIGRIGFAYLIDE